MNKRLSAAKVMRVVSILGVICLLALQWVWWRNAYRAVEVDMMSKTEDCLIRAADKAIMYQMDSTLTGIPVVNEVAGEKSPETKVLSRTRYIYSAFDIEYTMEECINVLKRPVTVELMDSKFCTLMNEEFGYVPKHTLSIHRNSTPINPTNRSKYNRVAFGAEQDSILHQFGNSAYAIVVLPTPIEHYMRKGAFIMVLSILLVMLIGGILIFQLINMQRERKFSDFIIDYTRMITHDLKSPTSGLQMIFNWLKDKEFKDEPEIEEKFIVDGLSLSNKIMLNLDNILYTAVSEQRELKVRLNDTPIREFMERVVDSYRIRSYFPKNIEYRTIYEPENFRCSLDMSMMENVMHNLIDNAIKFTPMETLIEIFCTRVGDEITIRVRDNGMGIPLNEQKRIFDLFEQGYTNHSSQFPGFGIGLHFVELALRAHEGKVSVQSEVGKGTEFTLTFISKTFSKEMGTDELLAEYLR